MASRGTSKPTEPRWLTKVPPADLKRTRGDHVIDFAEAMCKITKDSVAGQAGEPNDFQAMAKGLDSAIVRSQSRWHICAIELHSSDFLGKNGKSAWARGYCT
jgi:hypothetical protein